MIYRNGFLLIEVLVAFLVLTFSISAIGSIFVQAHQKGTSALIRLYTPMEFPKDIISRLVVLKFVAQNDRGPLIVSFEPFLLSNKP